MAKPPADIDRAHDLPVLLVIEEGPILDDLARDLQQRFSGDCQVLTRGSASEGLALLTDLAAKQVPVAVLIAGPWMREMSGVTFLSRAHELHPMAKRVLLVERDYTPGNPVVRAMMLGQVDFHLAKPWRAGTLYPAISEFLSAWSAQHPVVGLFQVVGEKWSTRSHGLRDLLTRFGIPFQFHTDDSPAGQKLLDEVGLTRSRLPVAVRFDGMALVDPSKSEALDALGVRTRPSRHSYDVAILGAGPAGLASAVYAASEGLETVVIESEVSGGQAGTSSLIRNYLGFAHGVSGNHLANEACEQAWLFGADLVFAQSAVGLEVRGRDRVIQLADGGEVTGKAVVVAVGVNWRRLGVPSLERLVGSGVFYGAGSSEAKAMEGLDVFVVGAGNSAGQAAVHLARHARSVTLLVRGESLTKSMSDYLVREIEHASNVSVRLGVEVVAGQGDGHLETVTITARASGATETVPASALFVMIGAEPRTEWVRRRLARDKRGFLLTGTDMEGARDLSPPWPLDRRSPLPLETNIPGIFAAGDVRHGSIKRVASAVGEGATTVQFMHQYFNEIHAAPEPVGDGQRAAAGRATTARSIRGR